MAAISAGAWAGMTDPGSILIGRRWPEIFRLLPEILPLSRPDKNGFRIKSGMTKKGRSADRGRLKSSPE
jgi:hypothetical protein